MKVKSESEVAQSCPTLSDPMDFGPPGSSINGIFQECIGDNSKNEIWLLFLYIIFIYIYISIDIYRYIYIISFLRGGGSETCLFVVS